MMFMLGFWAGFVIAFILVLAFIFALVLGAKIEQESSKGKGTF